VKNQTLLRQKSKARKLRNKTTTSLKGKKEEDKRLKGGLVHVRKGLTPSPGVDGEWNIKAKINVSVVIDKRRKMPQ